MSNKKTGTAPLYNLIFKFLNSTKNMRSAFFHS